IADQLTKRVVTPWKKVIMRSGDPTAAVARILRREIVGKRVSRNHPLESASGAKRVASFFLNHGANVALDVINLSIKDASVIEARADQEALKIAETRDVSKIREYLVYAQ